MNKKKYTIDPDSIGFFNFARGIGIIYVLLGHSISLLYTIPIRDKPFGNIFSISAAGCMTLFFLISGYGFRSRKMGKCIKRQAKLILIPYLITVSCIIGAKLVLAFIHQRSFWKFGGQYIFSYIFAINKGVNGGYNGKILGLSVDHVAMLWFFWALFGGWIICNVITQLKSITAQYILIILCASVGVGITYISSVWPFVLPQMLQAAGFIFIGFMIREHHLLQHKLPVWLYIAVAITIAISMVWGGVDMYAGVWKLGMLDYLGITALGFLYMLFFAWLGGKQKWNPSYNLISSIGEKTQIILCIHAFEEKVIPWHRLDSVFMGNRWIGCIVYFLLRCFFIFIAYQIVCLVNNNFFRKLRRKRKHIQLDIQE